MHTLKKFLSIAMILMLAVPVSAQNIGETLKSLVSDNAKMYMAPLPTVIGMGMNSATFQRARPHKILGFDATVSIGGFEVPDDKRTFQQIIPDVVVEFSEGSVSETLTLDSDLLYPGDREAQNLFGESDGGGTIAVDRTAAHDEIVTQLKAAGLSDAAVTAIDAQITSAAAALPDIPKTAGILPGGFPLFIPQLSLGLPMGIEVSLRGGLETDIPDFGSIAFTGFGAKVSVNQFIPTVPLLFPALSVGFYSTSLTLDTDLATLESTNSIINFQISKSIPFFMVYAGAGLETSNLDVSYNLDLGGDLGSVEETFSLEGTNSFRTTVGFRIKLALLTVHGAAVQGEFPGFYGGVGLTFR